MNRRSVIVDDTDLWTECAPYTKSSPERLFGMAAAIRYLDQSQIAGDVVECGVWRGGNIILTRLLSPNRVCWLYDTFDGMPEPELGVDITRSGREGMASYLGDMKPDGRWSKVTATEVEENLKKCGVFDATKLRFVAGRVENTLRYGVLPERISLLRLDTDWYASTRVELEQLWPLLVPGGVLIVDDYGHWLGAKQAVDEYFATVMHGWRPEMTMLDYTACQIIKPK